MTHEEEIAASRVALAQMHGKVNRYAGTAQAALEVIGVMQAHLSYLSEADKKRLAADLKARGLNIEQVVGFLGLVARKEG